MHKNSPRQHQLAPDLEFLRQKKCQMDPHCARENLQVAVSETGDFVTQIGENLGQIAQIPQGGTIYRGIQRSHGGMISGGP
jgi:hypothetical protein